MKITRTVLTLLVLVAALVSPALAQDTGSADFSSFVALGDSLTQGFTNGGIVAGVQEDSIPALIARQAGVGAGFEQPLVSSPGIPGLLQLQSLAPLAIVPRAGNGVPLNLQLPRPYNNLAVSGFDTRDVLETVTGNPIIDLTLRGLGPAIGQAAALQPTFAYVWIGNNDALGAATSGIVIDDVTLTTLPRFEMDYRAILGVLANAGAQLVVANIPDVTGIPFVNTLPPVLVDPATQQPVLVNGQPVPLIGPDGPLNPATDKVLLTAQAELAQGRGIPQAFGGSGQPLSDGAVLSGSEIARISNRIAGFNQIIRQAADDFGAAHFDANRFFDQVTQNGINIGGIGYDVSFLTGGIFSYDGVHPTPLGYAVLANRFIDTINREFGASMEPVGLLPFVTGEEGDDGAVLPPPPAGVSAGSVLFTEEAAEQVRTILDVPSQAALQRIQRRQERADDEQPDEEDDQPGFSARRLLGGG